MLVLHLIYHVIKEHKKINNREDVNIILRYNYNEYSMLVLHSNDK